MKTTELRALDKKHLWHPFTQMRDWMQSEPCVIAAAEGNWLIDTDGKRYLDAVSSLWTNVHGHCHPKINAAIQAQLERVAHSTLLGLASAPSIELAERLIALTPKSLERVFYSDSGSTSVEIALKIAYQYHQQAAEGDSRRTRFIAFTDAYHGDTIGSVSLGGVALYHDIYRPLLFAPLRAAAPYCYRCPHGKSLQTCGMGCLHELSLLLEKHGHECCALIVEPLVMGAAGMYVQPKGWLAGVRALCDYYGVFMIADEVAVGFGKTGTMFACEQEKVIPDILCLAKGLAGGYLPLAATLTTERIHQGFLGAPEENRTFFHGHTFTGNALACAAALANLDIFDEEKTLEKLQPKIAHLSSRLEDVRDLMHVGDVRQKGIMVGIELVEDSRTRMPYPVSMQIGHKIILEARNKGVILRPLGNVLVLMPPLSISIEEIDLMVDVCIQSIQQICDVRPHD